jgi:hypothetical protein
LGANDPGICAGTAAQGGGAGLQPIAERHAFDYLAEYAGMEFFTRRSIVLALPDFNAEGDMPPGIYPASLAEVLARFGQGSAQRRTVAGRLGRLY